MLTRSSLHALLAAVMLFASGCASSLVYNPSVNLPARPLHKEQGEALLNLSILPETRPHMTENDVAAGGAFTFRYGFSNTLTLGASGWADLRDMADGVFRGGFGAEGIIALNDEKSRPRFALMPRGAALFDGSSVEGGGFAFPVALWLPTSGIFTTYAAIGPAIGFRDLSADRAEWGYGMIGNLGSAIQLAQSLRANVEIVGVIQVNRYDNITHGIFAPSIGLGWSF